MPWRVFPYSCLPRLLAADGLSPLRELKRHQPFDLSTGLRVSLPQDERQVDRDVGGHHPHRVGQEGSAVEHRVEGDGVSLVVGRQGMGELVGGVSRRLPVNMIGASPPSHGRFSPKRQPGTRRIIAADPRHVKSRSPRRKHQEEAPPADDQLAAKREVTGKAGKACFSLCFPVLGTGKHPLVHRGDESPSPISVPTLDRAFVQPTVVISKATKTPG